MNFVLKNEEEKKKETRISGMYIIINVKDPDCYFVED